MAEGNGNTGSVVPAQQASLANVDLSGGVYASIPAFEAGQRVASALARSEIVPEAYRGNLPNCLVALDIAVRMKLPPMMVLQGLNVIQGRPAWSAQFIISAINASGLFSPLRFEFRGADGSDEWACRAWALDQSGQRCDGPWVGIKMAKDEGWYNRANSKWKTMPQQMMMYRAGAFFGRVYAGHILTGMTLTTDEIIDTEPVDVGGGSTVAAAAATSAAGGDLLAERVARRRRRGARGGDAGADAGVAGAPEAPENASGSPETAPGASAGAPVSPGASEGQQPPNVPFF